MPSKLFLILSLSKDARQGYSLVTRFASALAW
jgi:hypothetical protein